MSWWDRAACRGYPTAWWFATNQTTRDGVPVGEDDGPRALARAKAICATCPVSGHCHEEWKRARYEEGRTLYGLWGGMNAPVTRDNSTAIDKGIDNHGTRAGYRNHIRRGHVQARGEICQPCIDAKNAAKRKWRARQKLVVEPAVRSSVDGDGAGVA